MQVVIDIPNSLYANLKKIQRGSIASKRLLDCIKKGTPLPEGHGRIADMDEAIKCIEEVEGADAIWAISLIEWACGKRTIIEADKESGDKE